MIEIKQLRKSFGSLSVLGFGKMGLDASVVAGELVVLLGSNGCGKSTLFRCLLGLTEYEGGIAVSGKSPLNNGKVVRRLIGYMPQACGLHLDMTVEETLGFYSMLRKVSPDIAFRLLDRVLLGSKAERGRWRHMKVGELSGGMKQRLAYVVAAFSRPPILLLDEPIANLDRESQSLILSHLLELREEKTTILLSTHQKHDMLAVADRTLVMADGRLWDSETSVGAPSVGARAKAYQFEGIAGE